jgi:hypothetical protein
MSHNSLFCRMAVLSGTRLVRRLALRPPDTESTGPQEPIRFVESQTEGQWFVLERIMK